MIEKINEIAYIIIPEYQFDEDIDAKIKEITALTESAGAVIFSYIVYPVREISPATFIGSGKLTEIFENIVGTDVNLIVFDGELTPSQTLNISSALDGVKVIDRTTLILDIFASNAVSSEGKTQIELAQLKYIYPRLKGKGEALSRLGGGIGTRGPGETKLETDRRHIRTRITALEKKLEELKNRRSLQMQRREKNSCKTVAIVGYTNAGKSTLLNALTGADAYVKDKLFATLDPTIRKLKLEDFEVVLIDTVGFVRNIPHHIIEAFKSTLELAVKSDLILNVCDGSGNWQRELEVTYETLHSFKDVPTTVTVINKCDKIDNFDLFPKDAVFISAQNGVGLDKLKYRINKEFSAFYSILSFNLPYTLLNEFSKLVSFTEKIEYEYLDTHVKIIASVQNRFKGKFDKFLNKD